MMNNRVVKVEDVISLIDEKIEFLKQQNGAGVIFKMREL